VDPRASLVLYDADCGFCRYAVDRLLDLDRGGSLRAAPIQGPEGEEHLASVPPSRRTDSMHVVTRDGTVRSGGAGLAPILRALPGGAVTAAIAERFPGTAERLYRLVADHRAALGRLVGAEACAVDPQRPRPAVR
jgi:predicted DCC family thiol-disulfide oxidoreductase YuxK